jgi:hypothetical protein
VAILIAVLSASSVVTCTTTPKKYPMSLRNAVGQYVRDQGVTVCGGYLDSNVPTHLCYAYDQKRDAWKKAQSLTMNRYETYVYLIIIISPAQYNILIFFAGEVPSPRFLPTVISGLLAARTERTYSETARFCQGRETCGGGGRDQTYPNPFLDTVSSKCQKTNIFWPVIIEQMAVYNI